MFNVFEIISLSVFTVFCCVLIVGYILSQRRCNQGGMKHTFYTPQFRVRVCVNCGRREVLMRSWEFDGYDDKILKMNKDKDDS